MCSVVNAWPAWAAGGKRRQEEGIIKSVVEKMAAQLEVLNSKIERLAAKTLMAGDQISFEDLLHIDELKALYAIAQSKLDEFRAAQALKETHLEVELKTAFAELKAALKDGKPPP